MKQYLELIDRVVKYGNLEEHDRTGVGTLNLFSEKMYLTYRQASFLSSQLRRYFSGVSLRSYCFFFTQTVIALIT